MCAACEMNFWSMIDALPPEVRERILRQQSEQFACEAPEPARADAQPIPDERKPVVTKP
jgi:hypothetical protein